MSSSTSLKELSKAIVAFMQEPVAPLPEDLVDTIAAYLRRHQKYDNAAADRLQEELLSIFEKHVKGRTSAVGAWFGIIRRLLPVLQTHERILVWFDTHKGIMDNILHDRGFVEEVVAGLMDLITVADEYAVSTDSDSVTNPIIDRLMLVWLERYYPAFINGVPGMENNERMVREALCNFGKKKPKQLFASLDGCLVQKQHRKAALRFFCEFIQTQPPRLHEVQQTSLFGHLLTSLQHDTSTAIVSAGLTALVMLLPHMPGSLVPRLPTLFNIYARILFWEKERSGSIEAPAQSEDGSQWEICAYDPGLEDFAIPQLPNYYTILYGLFPINFMDYIRKPQRYLRHANDSGADDVRIQSTEMRYESEKYRKRHLLHPNFYTLTIETEKTDVARWIKTEAPEVVAECMSLCISNDDFGTGDTVGRTIRESNAESDRVGDHATASNQSMFRINSWESNALMRTDSLFSNMSPSKLPPHDSASLRLPGSGSVDDGGKEIFNGGPPPTSVPEPRTNSHLQDMIQSNKAIKATLTPSLTNDSVHSLTLSQQDAHAERVLEPSALGNNVHSSSVSMSGIASQVAHLQRQIMLLQNDLSFERFLKQQHMAHIGDLRRRQVAEAATEAETQNLIMMNRNLKSRYEEAKKAEMQVRKESEKSRAMAKKWDADLSNKLKLLRDESKKTTAELHKIRKELDDSILEREKLKKMVCDNEVEELTRKQNIQSIELHATEVNRLKAEVERLTSLERGYQAKELERQRVVTAAMDAENQVESLRLQLAAQSGEVQRTRRLFKTQVSELQERLSSLQEENVRQGASSNVAVEEVLAGSRAKQAEMQRQLDLLNRKYTTLQSSLLDMQSETPKQKLKLRTAGLHDAIWDGSQRSTSPTMMRSRTGRALSDADQAGPPPVTPNSPIELTKVMSVPLGRSQHQAQPEYTEPHPGNPVLIGSPTSLSSQTEIYTGGGPAQNWSRKDSKAENSKEASTSKTKIATTSGSRKDKKAGFRGIRGLY